MNYRVDSDTHSENQITHTDSYAKRTERFLKSKVCDVVPPDHDMPQYPVERNIPANSRIRLHFHLMPSPCDLSSEVAEIGFPGSRCQGFLRSGPRHVTVAARRHPVCLQSWTFPSIDQSSVTLCVLHYRRQAIQALANLLRILDRITCSNLIA